MTLEWPSESGGCAREWKARSGGDLELRESTSGELTAAKSLDADAVIYPVEMLGDLAERQWLHPLPAAWLAREEFHQTDLFEPAGLAECRWGDSVYAVPFGSAVFTGLYRRDVFERLHLSSPRTWAEYKKLLDAVDEHIDASGDMKGAAIEPLADGWAAKYFLARAAAYAKHRDYDAALFDTQSMAPLIDAEPFVRALTELVAEVKANAAQSLRATPADARRALLNGQCVVAIGWPSAAGRDGVSSEQKSGDRKFDLGVFELPGSAEVFNPHDRRWQTRADDDDLHVPLLDVAGRIGSIAKANKAADRAFQLLALLYADQRSVDVSAASPATAPYRVSQLRLPGRGRWCDFAGFRLARGGRLPASISPPIVFTPAMAARAAAAWSCRVHAGAGCRRSRCGCGKIDTGRGARSDGCGVARNHSPPRR